MNAPAPSDEGDRSKVGGLEQQGDKAKATWSGALSALPRTVWALGWVSLLTDAATDMIYPLLPELLARVGATAIALGVMEGLAELVSAILKIWSGAATDRGRSPKAMVVSGYFLSSSARPLMAFARTGWLVILLRVVDRLGKGIRGAPRDAILAGATAPGQRGLAFGVHRAMDNLGAVVGGGMSFILLGAAHLPLDTVVFLSLVPGLASTAVALLFIDKPEKLAPAPKKAIEAPPEEAVVAARAPLPRTVKIALVVFSIFALSASADSFLMAHITKLGLSLYLVPLAWISLQLAKSVLNVPGGALADRVGPRRVVAASYAVYALSYAAFAFVSSPWMFWALLPVYAFYYGFGEGAERALLVRLAPKVLRGRTLGLANAVQGACLLPANVVFGVLYVRSPALAFEVTAGIALVAAILFAVFVGEGDFHD